MITFYLKSAIRSISRKKIFSVLNITGLALGITVFLLTLEYFSYETGFNKFHANLPNLYRVNVSTSSGKSPSTVPNIAPLIQQQIPGVKAAVRFADNFASGAVISYRPANDLSKQITFREEGCVFVDKEFLTAFTFPFVEGSNELDKENAVIITSSVAKKIFGNEKALGKTIVMHNQFGTLTCVITGVLADLPLQSDIKFDYLFSTEILKSNAYTAGSDWAKLDNWNNNSYATYAWLDANTNPVTVAAAASALWAKKSPDYKKEDGIIQLQPVSEIHLGKNFKDDNPSSGSRAIVFFIFGLGILVLCVAWINYINFSTAHALSQAKEIGIHKITGSSSRQIVFRYITESLLLNLAGLIVAYFLITFMQDHFNYLTAKPLSIIYINQLRIWLLSGFTLFAGVLFCGGYVGWVLAKFKPVTAITFNDGGNNGNTLLRKGLVIFQFVIAVVFISSTVIAYKQLGFMKHHELGMNIENLTAIEGPEIKDSSTKAGSVVFKNELAKLPFVSELCSTGSIPGDGFAHNFGMDGVTKMNPEKGDERKNYFASEVDEKYFDLYKIPFLKGRNFTMEEADKSFKAGKLILNETTVQTLGMNIETILHQFIKWNDKNWEIVGVVRDYHHRSLKEKIEPIIYIPQHNTAYFTIKMQPGDFTKKMAGIKSLYEKIFPGNPFGYKIVQDVYDTQYADEQRAETIAFSISILVVFIACLGLIGLSLFTAKRRAKEIGIRRVLGAGTASLFALLSKDFLKLVLIAFLIATPVCWYVMSRWLQDFAYRITISWEMFAGAGVMLFIIALITVSLLSLKAAITNPVKSLRSE
jgi:putative ABC transport system permease protein